MTITSVAYKYGDDNTTDDRIFKANCCRNSIIGKIEI